MRVTRLVCLICFCLCLGLVRPVALAESSAFWPGVSYDPAIPSLKQIAGHEPGEKLTSNEQSLAYLEALVKAAPQRTMLVEYGKTWNDRPLNYLVVSSPENLANLSANQNKMRRFVDPRTYTEAEQAGLAADIVPVSWMSYGVHGDEISPTDAALLLAYHLVASVNDATVDKILTNSIVVIDPVQNPDGRARFMSHLEQNVGLQSMPHHLSTEHQQAWPRGRTNQYLFDMNRDWFAMTQPETKGRIAVYQDFYPVVHADVHEMGTNQTYYFPPPTPPYNPHISEQQKRNLVLYGKGNAAAFDDFDFDYFTRETFDAHYAGYGDTWPTFHGTVAQTFEASSARGLVQRKRTGELVTYRSGVHRHFVASMATLLTTATHGQKLLNDLAQYRRQALEADQHYLFSGDASLQDKLMGKLIAQGIEVHALTESSRVCGTARPAGSYVVKAGQPAGHLVRTLLDADSPVRGEFWQEVERKREQGLDVGTYDVLAWSMPALYGLEVEICQRDMDELERLDEIAPVANQWQNAEYGYLIENNTSASMAFLSAALLAGIEVRNVGGDFSIGSRRYERGTLLIKTANADDALHQQIQSLANAHQIDLVSLNESWTSSGINFGSDYVSTLRAPKVALAWDSPTYITAAGGTRFVIERQLGYPVTTIRTRHLLSRSLEYFDVVILPDGGDYVGELGELGATRLKQWVERGGVLITLGEATRLLIDENYGLLSTRLEANLMGEATQVTKGRAPASTIDSEDEYVAIITEGLRSPEPVSGILARGETESSHWLSAGTADTLFMMYEGSDIYAPLRQVDGTNVVRFAGEDELLHGGYIWQENRSQLAFKPAVMATTYGEGSVIGFVVNPTFRGFMDGFHVMLGNGIFKGPSQ